MRPSAAWATACHASPPSRQAERPPRRKPRSSAMIKPPLPKLFGWLMKGFAVSAAAGFALAAAAFGLFFKEGFSGFALAFSLGFFLSLAFSGLLFLRIFHPLSRVASRIRDIAQGKSPPKREDDSFLSDLGEFYDMNRNLKRISGYLRWQKKIITQESSELEAVISAVTGAILAVDRNQKILFFNNQAALLFSPRRRAGKSGMALSEIMRSPDILGAYRECLKAGKTVKKSLPIDAMGAEELSYEATIAPLKGPDGGVHGAVGLFYDITNIKKTEKVHIDFISNVSHELRTPLTAIQGYVQTLLSELDKGSREQIRQFLGVINRNVKRLVSLLNHFLDLCEMEASMDLKKEELSTEKITESIVKDLNIKDHRLKLDFSAPRVKADRHFLKQVLYNLLDNAVRYVPRGRLIEVLWAKDGGHVVLTVRDHGEGIPSPHRDRLFEKFYKIDPARQSGGAKGGSGIGLAIVKQLMERHGGTARLVSGEKEGSSFICAFPDESLPKPAPAAGP